MTNLISSEPTAITPKFNYQAFIQETLQEGVWTGSKINLIRTLSELEAVVNIRTVSEYRGDTWIEVLRDLPDTILNSTYQQVGGVQVTERWLQVEVNAFVRELIKPQTFSYD
jgi:hypothetical protein